ARRAARERSDALPPPAARRRARERARRGPLARAGRVPDDADGPAAAARRRALRRHVRRAAHRGPGAVDPRQHRYAAARRALPAVRLKAVRIALDVSPLSHERTGVNNYILGSLRGLAAVAHERGHEVVAFAPTSPEGKRVIADTVNGLPVDLRLKVFLGAHGW